MCIVVEIVFSIIHLPFKWLFCKTDNYYNLLIDRHVLSLSIYFYNICTALYSHIYML